MIIVPSLRLSNTEQLAVGAVDPRAQLNEWEWLGFQRAHLIEAAAPDRRPLGRHPAEDLLPDIHIEVEVSGDIQSADDIEVLIGAGAARVVLGSRAIDEAEWLASVASAFPNALVLETAARERRVRSRGWTRTLPVDVRDLIDEVSSLPLAALQIRFDSDATIDHGDLSLIEDLVERSRFPLEVAGAVQTLASLRDLEFRGAAAVIIDSGHLGDALDEQTLARSFVD